MSFSLSQLAAITGPESKMLNNSEEQSENVIIIHSNSDGAADTHFKTDKGRFHQDRTSHMDFSVRFVVRNGLLY